MTLANHELPRNAAAQVLEITHFATRCLELTLHVVHDLLDLVQLSLNVVNVAPATLDRPIQQGFAHLPEFLDSTLQQSSTALGDPDALRHVDQISVGLLHVSPGTAIIVPETLQTALNFIETTGNTFTLTLEVGTITMNGARLPTDSGFGMIDALEAILEAPEALAGLAGLAACGIPSRSGALPVSLAIFWQVFEIPPEISGAFGFLVEIPMLTGQDLLPHLEITVLGLQLTQPGVELVDLTRDPGDFTLKAVSLSPGRVDVGGETAGHDEFLVQLALETVLLFRGTLPFGEVPGPITLETVDLTSNLFDFSTHLATAGRSGPGICIDTLTKLVDGCIGTGHRTTDKLITTTQRSRLAR